jgi:hypothetical protein
MAHDHLLEKAREFHRLIAAHPAEFALGYAEGDGDVGMTYDDDPGSDRSLAYDLGRSLRQGRGDEETVTLTFVPQAWQNDYAVDVDPEGPTTFAVPRKDVAGLAPDSHASDDLRFHPNAPEWIKNWSGPFRIDFDAGEDDDLRAFAIREGGDREDDGIDTHDWHAALDEDGYVAALFATHDHAVAFVDVMNEVL